MAHMMMISEMTVSGVGKDLNKVCFLIVKITKHLRILIQKTSYCDQISTLFSKGQTSLQHLYTMCYDAQYLIKRQLREAERRGTPLSDLDELWNELKRISTDPILQKTEPGHWKDDKNRLGDYYHVSGFQHPYAVIMTGTQATEVKLAKWGLIPFWVKSITEAYDFRKPYNCNLNAQVETFLEKKAFSNAAKYKRCVIQVDAYYENHHANKTTYPFRIAHKNGPLWLAAVYETNKLLDTESGELFSMNSFAILTTRANRTLSRIHNNPKMVNRTGHRMLGILEEDQLSAYLKNFPGDTDPLEIKIFEQEMKELIQPYEDDKLVYHPVRNLRPRKNQSYIGNVPEITKEYHWPDLDLESILNF
jgi:putative SOS response-associated peptidase YedK